MTVGKNEGTTLPIPTIHPSMWLAPQRHLGRTFTQRAANAYVGVGMEGAEWPGSVVVGHAEGFGVAGMQANNLCRTEVPATTQTRR